MKIFLFCPIGDRQQKYARVLHASQNFYYQNSNILNFVYGITYNTSSQFALIKDDYFSSKQVSNNFIFNVNKWCNMLKYCSYDLGLGCFSLQFNKCMISLTPPFCLLLCKYRGTSKDRLSSTRFARLWICWRKIILAFATLTMQNKG